MIKRGRVQREEQKVVGNHFSDRLGAQPYQSLEQLCLIISSKSGRSSCNKLATLWWHSITEKNSSPKCLHKFFNHILPPPATHTPISSCTYLLLHIIHHPSLSENLSLARLVRNEDRFSFFARKVQNSSLNLFSPSPRVEIYGLAVMVKFAVKLVRMALYISGCKSILDLWLTNAKRKSHIWTFVESYNVETKTGMFQKMENIIHGMPSLIRTPFHQS